MSLPVKKRPEEAARDLVPKAIPFDSIGKPLTVFEAVTIDRPEEKTVDPPWEGWLNSVVTETVGQQHSAKLAFRQACLWANVHTDHTTHIALTSLDGVVSVVATEDIEVGGLTFPCFSGTVTPCIRRRTNEVALRRKSWAVFHGPRVSKQVRTMNPR